MLAALKAGLAYFAIVFAAGVGLGTLRVLALAPALGNTLAVIIELPVMLAIAWIACGSILSRLSVPGDWPARLVMGAFAFGLLMIAEVFLGVFVSGRTLWDDFAIYRTAQGSLGLIGQLAFAAFPLVRSR